MRKKSDEEDEEESDELKGQPVTVTSTSEKDEIISGKLDGEGKTLKLYVGQGLDVDWDKVKKGTALSVDAKKDDDDHRVRTKVTVKRKTARQESNFTGSGCCVSLPRDVAP